MPQGLTTLLLLGMLLYLQSMSTFSKKKSKFNVASIFISDLHLGTNDSKADECREFLRHFHCERLVLIGDIIDVWALMRGGKWTRSHTRFLRSILKKIEKEDTEVIYLRGNHDEILERIIPLSLGGLQMSSDYIHHSKDNKKYLCLHGDGFDSISTNHHWIAVLGSIGYDILLYINRLYNRYRSWRGKEYYSVSQAIKAKVKSAVNFIGKYEKQLELLAHRRNCAGIIAGHIHHPSNKVVGETNIHYLNCGDWVESLSAIVELNDGSFHIVLHNELNSFLAQHAPQLFPAAPRSAEI